MKKKVKTEKKRKKRKGTIFRFLRWGTLLPILIFALIGILLCALPQDSVSMLSILTGVLLCALGVLFLASAFSEKKAGFLQLICGIAQISFAVWLFVEPEGALFILLMVFAALLFLRALIGICSSVSVKQREGFWWQIELIGSLAVLVFSFVLFFNLFEVRHLVLVIGILMLFTAALETVALVKKLFSQTEQKKADRQDKAEKEEKGEQPARSDEVEQKEEEPKRGGLFRKKREKKREEPSNE